MHRQHQRPMFSHLHWRDRTLHGRPVEGAPKQGHTALSDEDASGIGQHARTTDHHFRPEDITYLAREGNKMARGIKKAIYTRALDPPLNRGGGLRHLLPHTYDDIISATICPPKPPPPSAPGSLTPTFNINDARPKGCPPGSRNRVLCLPLVDAAIALAATPTIAPQASFPPPAAMCRPGCPRKDTTTATAGTPAVATASAAPLPVPPTHVMTTCARTLCAVAGAAPSTAPRTQAS
jgi:hypothetical protein